MPNHPRRPDEAPVPAVTESFDEEDLEQAGQDDLTRGAPLPRLLAKELYESAEPSLVAKVHESREERNQEGRVRRAERAMADQHPNVRWAPLDAEPEFAIGRATGGVSSTAGSRLDAVKSYAEGTRAKSPFWSRLVSGRREAAHTVEDQAVEDLTSLRAPNAPRAAGADEFRVRWSRVTTSASGSTIQSDSRQ